MKLVVSKPRFHWKTDRFDMKNNDRPVAFDYRVVELQDGKTLTLASDERVVGVVP